MRTKRLEIEYRLSGVGIPVSETDAPYTINHALARAGLLTDRYSGMGVLEGEWAYNRPFALEGTFASPSWDSERTYIEFEWLRGAGRVLVNGGCAGSFAGGPLTVDATAHVRAGTNALRVEFDPAQERGIIGAVRLRGCWSLHVRGMRLEATPGGIRAVSTVSAHAAGRYVFRYAVSAGGEAIDTYEFELQLGAKVQTATHELPVGALDAYGPAAPKAYMVRLTVLRAGDECDGYTGWTGGTLEDCAGRAVLAGDADGQEARLMLLLEAGARRFEMAPGAYLPEAFLERADECGAAVFGAEDAPVSHACLRGAAPDEYAGAAREPGMRLLEPPARPIPEIAFRALGGADVLALRPGELLGGCLPGDIARLSRLMRFIQAQRIAALAEREPERALDIGGGCALAASCDLFDDGVPRPAYYALKAAWSARGVYALTGGMAFEPGAAVSVPVYARGGGFERVRAELLDSAGSVLSRAEFLCGGEGGRVGELMFVLGRECAAYLLRLTGMGGGPECLRDYPICVRGEAQLQALAVLPPARVKREGDEYVNLDAVIALGVVRADGGCALLPGERAPLLLAGGVNAFVYSQLSGDTV